MSMIRKLRPMAPRSRCIACYWATWGITYVLALTLAAELAASEKAIASPPSSSGSHDSLRSVWPMRLKHGFHQALERGLGFSLVLDGQRIGPAVPADSSVTTRERDGMHETLFRHPLAFRRTPRARSCTVRRNDLDSDRRGKGPMTTRSGLSILSISLLACLATVCSSISSTRWEEDSSVVEGRNGDRFPLTWEALPCWTGST